MKSFGRALLVLWSCMWILHSFASSQFFGLALSFSFLCSLWPRSNLLLLPVLRVVQLFCLYPPLANHNRPIIWTKQSRRVNLGLQHLSTTHTFSPCFSVCVCVSPAFASWVMSSHRIIWKSSGSVTHWSRSVADIDITFIACSFIS